MDVLNSLITVWTKSATATLPYFETSIRVYCLKEKSWAQIYDNCLGNHSPNRLGDGKITQNFGP